jgi:large subunit ribosomal protein L7A
MSYEKVSQAKQLIIGTKQTVKALKADKVDELIIALDADPGIAALLQKTAEETGVDVAYVDSKMKLGKACGIQVGAAAAAILM